MAAASPSPNDVSSNSPIPPAISATNTTTATAASPAPSPSTSAATANPTNQNTSSSAKPPGLPTITLQRADSPKTLRGLNKPKCIKCGNVARSRCPYQSCKSCCSKAQNPCHIHVLKPNSTLADKSPANSVNPEQHTSDAPTSGPSHKASSIRQLSSNFSQFNNLQVPRSRKPLTRKEAIDINEWRFSKLKEFRDSNIDAENEAFDRYMQNINLLEEVFDGHNEGNTEEDGSLRSYTSNTAEDEMDMLTGLKSILRSHPARLDRARERIRNAMDQGLGKLRKINSVVNNDAIDEEAPEPAQTLKRGLSWKAMALDELNEKLNKVRNEEDLEACMQMLSQIRGQVEPETRMEAESDEELKGQFVKEDDSEVELEFDHPLVRAVKVDQDELKSMNGYFDSLNNIKSL